MLNKNRDSKKKVENVKYNETYQIYAVVRS